MPEAKEQLILSPLEGYAPALGYALASLEWERTQTLKTVAGLSLPELEACPEGFSNSIATLLYHVALVELDWLYVEILEQDIPEAFMPLFPLEAREANGRLSPVKGMHLEEHLERLGTVRQAVLERLHGMDTDEFYRVRHLEPYDVNPAWVLYHLLEHEAKHGEQMTQLRRVLAARG